MRRLLDGVAVCVSLLDSVSTGAPDSLIDMRTGGNDNAVRVWSASKLGAGAQELQGHGAAVKALAWSPHHRGRLATGDGMCGNQSVRRGHRRRREILISAQAAVPLIDP